MQYSKYTLLQWSEYYYSLSKNAFNIKEIEKDVKEGLGKLYFHNDGNLLINTLKKYKEFPEVLSQALTYIRKFVKNAIISSIKMSYGTNSSKAAAFLRALQIGDIAGFNVAKTELLDPSNELESNIRHIEEFFTDNELNIFFINTIQDCLNKKYNSHAFEVMIDQFMKSKKINHSLIKRVVRLYIPEIFSRLYEKEHNMTYSIANEEEFKNKSNYNVDDIIFLINGYLNHTKFSFNDLKNIYFKSNKAAQQILRSIIYFSSDTFILDDDAKPLGSDNNIINIDSDSDKPLYIPTTMRGLNDTEKMEWANLFADYHIIPYFRYFNEENS